ncbi:hypothetical protein ASG01_11610 [Chryseobacterium sp. Leaf180]|uniref:chorismate-binding protein n=1 Tax=Chryseobacterium sp. Leaf180 TaxID=1736289 RepID=UPI000701A201|nr:chorismate-binding protein [Chryseobacterium sp. Leaf180]KQR92553.1 hypothetical protein ASG01_11610 [Chryseobacterium sp. Leaf180]
MVYFKFPFNEKLFSTDENTDESTVQFKSFDENLKIEFHGKIIERQSLEIDSEKFYETLKSGDPQIFKEETKEEYLEKLQNLIQIIKDKNLPKVVLSRRKIRENYKIDPEKSFENLCKAYPNAFRYIFFKNGICWIGAFSELLGKYSKSDGSFETMSLAGTLPVSDAWTEKEIEEQKPVSQYIKNILENFSDELKISETYDHISGNIKHLRTDFEAKIQRKDLDKIIHELHPTPAVCGIPKDICKTIISNFEKYPRELYSGYIRIETESEIHFYVNLRCARIFENSVHAFVGGGVTSQSNPEKEWQETELKSHAIFNNLTIIKKGI